MRGLRWSDGVSWARRYAWHLLGVAAILALFSPMLFALGDYGKGDWGYFHFIDTVARRTVLDYGQLPEWNPYYCGGNVLAGAPQAHVWSPTFVFVLIFGPAAGAKLSIVFHALVGLAGMFLLLGALGQRGAGRFLGAVVFLCSGFFAQHVSGGHVWAVPFYYLPLVLFLFLRGCHEPRWAALGGGVWALTALEGGVYPAPYTGLLLAAAGLAMALGWTPMPDRPRARWTTTLLALVLASVFFATVAAVRLVPVAAHLGAHPRLVTTDYDRIEPGTLLDTFVQRHREWGWDRPSHHNARWWGEYGDYVGWPVLVLAAAAALTRLRRARVPLAFLVLTLVVMLGSIGRPSLWDALHRLPVFDCLKVPTRFRVFASLVLACLAGWAVCEGQAVLRARLGRGRFRWVSSVLPAVVAIGVATDVVVLNASAFVDRFVDPPPPVQRPPGPMTQVHGSFARMYHYPVRNEGTIICQENNSIHRSRRVRPGPPDYAVEPPDAGQLSLVEWTPNALRLNAILAREALVLVNQNYHRGWSSSVGRVESLDDQLAVRLLPGHHRLSLTSPAPGLRAGLGLSVAGLSLLAIWFGIHAWWRRRHPAGLPNGAAPPAATPDGEARPSPPEPSGGRPRRPAPPPPRLRRLVVDAAWVLALLGGFLAAIALREEGEPVWTVRVHDYVRQRHRDGDTVQMNPDWVGEAARRFRGLHVVSLRTRIDALEEGARLWYVFCEHDGDRTARDDILHRLTPLDSFRAGHYVVHVLQAPRGDPDSPDPP